MKFFLEALLLSLTNPKGLILVAALIPPFVNHSLPVLPQVAILSLTFATMCFFNHLFLAFAPEAGQGGFFRPNGVFLPSAACLDRSSWGSAWR